MRDRLQAEGDAARDATIRKTAHVRNSWLTIEGVRIAVRESGGSGPAVIMVHGNSSSSFAFRRQLEGPLGEEFRLIGFDLPGHGDSGRPVDAARTYSFPGFAAVLRALARAMDAQNGIFLGWSLGGHVVLEAAADLPDAAGFVIFGAPPLRFPPNIEEACLPNPVLRLVFREELSEDELTEWTAALFRPGAQPDPGFTDLMRRADPRMRSGLLASVGTVGYHDEGAVVRGLGKPLAILNGEHDSVVSMPYVRSLEIPLLWRGAIQVIEGAGHTPQWENPSTFDRLVGDFVRDVAGGGLRAA